MLNNLWFIVFGPPKQREDAMAPSTPVGLNTNMDGRVRESGCLLEPIHADLKGEILSMSVHPTRSIRFVKMSDDKKHVKLYEFDEKQGKITPIVPRADESPIISTIEFSANGSFVKVLSREGWSEPLGKGFFRKTGENESVASYLRRILNAKYLSFNDAKKVSHNDIPSSLENISVSNDGKVAFVVPLKHQNQSLIHHVRVVDARDGKMVLDIKDPIASEDQLEQKEDQDKLDAEDAFDDQDQDEYDDEEDDEYYDRDDEYYDEDETGDEDEDETGDEDDEIYTPIISCISPDGTLLAVNFSEYNKVHLFNTTNPGKLVVLHTEESYYVKQFVFSQDSKRLAIVAAPSKSSLKKQIFIFDATQEHDADPVRTLDTGDNTAKSFAFHPSNEALLAYAVQNQVIVRNIENKQTVCCAVHDPLSISFFYDQNYLAILSGTGIFKFNYERVFKKPEPVSVDNERLLNPDFAADYKYDNDRLFIKQRGQWLPVRDSERTDRGTDDLSGNVGDIHFMGKKNLAVKLLKHREKKKFYDLEMNIVNGINDHKTARSCGQIRASVLSEAGNGRILMEKMDGDLFEGLVRRDSSNNALSHKKKMEDKFNVTKEAILSAKRMVSRKKKEAVEALRLAKQAKRAYAVVKMEDSQGQSKRTTLAYYRQMKDNYYWTKEKLALAKRELSVETKKAMEAHSRAKEAEEKLAASLEKDPLYQYAKKNLGMETITEASLHMAALNITEEIRKQVACLYSAKKKWFYYDLKPENVFYKLGAVHEPVKIKLGDLGSLDGVSRTVSCAKPEQRGPIDWSDRDNAMRCLALLLVNMLYMLSRIDTNNKIKRPGDRENIYTVHQYVEEHFGLNISVLARSYDPGFLKKHVDKHLGSILDPKSNFLLDAYTKGMKRRRARARSARARA